MDEASEARSRVGEVVAGKYHLERLLGSGGMGAVYEAVHAFTQRRVAVKLMHGKIARSKVAAERFLREARAPGTIGHAGIVEVLDGGHADDGSLYIVMEVLKGETLASAMRARRLHLQETSAIVLELLDILAAAHAAGFVHRDIKPDNVFLASEDDDDPNAVTVKLLDFGVAGMIEEEGAAKDHGKLTRAGAVLGTPLYMSPEQALGRSVDARADIWSVGALLYQALAGMPPYRGESFQALVVSISTQEHTPLGVLRPDLPPRLHAVVERALRKDPQKRWASAHEMADALEAAVEGRATANTQRTLDVEPFSTEASVARAAAPREDESHAAKRLALYGAIAVTLLGGLGYLLTARSSAPEPAPQALEGLAAQPPVAAPAPGPRPEPVAAEPEPEAAEPAARAAEPEPEATEPAAPAAEPPAPESLPATQPRGLSSDTLTTVLSAGQAGLQRCYEQAIVEALTQGNPPPPALHLDVSMTIAKDGAVRSASVEGKAARPLTTCIEAAVRALRFPASDAESSARFPVVFQPAVVGQ